MKRFAVATGIALCAVAISGAHAADGRILMVGSVVAPTCAPGAVGSRDASHDLHIQCPNAPLSTRYTLHLEPATASRVRLVEYYDGYVRANGTGQSAWVATQTYD